MSKTYSAKSKTKAKQFSLTYNAKEIKSKTKIILS